MKTKNSRYTTHPTVMTWRLSTQEASQQLPGVFCSLFPVVQKSATVQTNRVCSAVRTPRYNNNKTLFTKSYCLQYFPPPAISLLFEAGGQEKINTFKKGNTLSTLKKKKRIVMEDNSE